MTAPKYTLLVNLSYDVKIYFTSDKEGLVQLLVDKGAKEKLRPHQPSFPTVFPAVIRLSVCAFGFFTVEEIAAPNFIKRCSEDAMFIADNISSQGLSLGDLLDDFGQTKTD